jgi:hypothetical protein
MCEFLSRFNTEQSVSLQGDIDKKDQEIQTKVKLCFEEMNNILSAKVKDISDRDRTVSSQKVSGRSHCSSSAASSLRCIHAQKKVYAEAARGKLEFLEKEKELQTNELCLLSKIRCLVLRHNGKNL